MLKTRIEDIMLLIALFLTGVFSRIFFLEKMQSHWDGPDYTLGLIHYSFAQQTPSPPGYPLYIVLGKVFYIFIKDPHNAILGISVLFAGIGAVVFYFCGKLFFNHSVGIISALLFLSAPTIYFFGITANPYGGIPTTSAIVASIVYLVVVKKRNYGFLLGTVFSCAVGFRPQDAIFLSPLFIFGIIYLKSLQRIFAFVTFFLVFFLWFFPTIKAVGGLLEYIRYLHFTSSIPVQLNFYRVSSIWFIIVKGVFLTFGLSAVFFFYYALKFPFTQKKLLKFRKSKDKLVILIFLLWLSPSFLFNVFVRSDHAAHQMTYLSSFLILISYAIWKTTKKHSNVLTGVVVVICLFNLFTFFRNRDQDNSKPYISQSYHYSEIQKNDIRLSHIVSYVSNKYSPINTVILVDPEIFRPVMYYLKMYQVYSYSSLDTNIFPYVNVIHYGYNWNYSLTIDSSHLIKTTQHEKTIICITNNKKYFFQNTIVNTEMISGGTFLYIISTKPNSTFLLSLHTIKQIGNM